MKIKNYSIFLRDLKKIPMSHWILMNVQLMKKILYLFLVKMEVRMKVIPQGWYRAYYITVDSDDFLIKDISYEQG